MSSHMSTKEKILHIVDDIELISKELIENLIAPKQQKLSSADHQLLTELLVSKDKDLKNAMKLASEQAAIEVKINAVKSEVERQDQHILQFQRQLKEAEQILSTALYQARQKLQSINKANKKPVSTEELIKYAHRISSSNAVCAPLTWHQGDMRRPYPTDLEMRSGFLSRPDLPLNGHGIPHQNIVNDVHRGGHAADIPASSQSQFAWHPSGELHMTMGSSGGMVTLDTRASHKETNAR
ncbi:mediator of RNA polymerase II transcription subunit 4-like [Ctenocephalides felis]|uniref:mediator of RNA polymerase II transcription subunit 4-like n=1 Tax=Ctenocephalides felis TaxID=7515 RepID=UPI000E6E205D|nr:mediator of RNA polymerase II transcription subunit 4-like [Ctenocephalides felis]